MANVSVLILTLNEEINLPRCLDALKWCDDIVVLDSHSSDRTLEISTAAGARIVQRKFDNWASHQNWAVSNISFKHRWVYYIDADEVMNPDLAGEVQRIASDPNTPHVAYRVRRKDMFFGRWVRHSSMYPIWIVRLFLPSKVRWERLVNPVCFVDGSEGQLQGHMMHYTFNKGLHAWMAKHNDYARLEAQECLKSLETGSVDFAGIFSRDFVRRRKALKTLSFRMPFRPLLRFLYMYLFRGGFLDGWAGFTHCKLVSIYEYLIVLNMKEILRRRSDLPV
jgi:glycosyltransferase involved in cell wall biosynthesis